LGWLGRRLGLGRLRRLLRRLRLWLRRLGRLGRLGLVNSLSKSFIFYFLFLINNFHTFRLMPN
jgi:hypothetical protein